MSIIDVPAEPTIRKPKRKYRRRKLPPAIAKPAGGPAGITEAKCPNACNADACWITGRAICGHPFWGGHHVKGQEAIQRFNAAKKALGKRRLEVV